VDFRSWTSVSRKIGVYCMEELNGLHRFLRTSLNTKGKSRPKNVFYTGAAPNTAIPAVD